METVELGGVRLHVLTAYPGLPGDGERLTRALAKLDPAVVLLDVDTDDALRLRDSVGDARTPFHPSYADALLAEEMRRRFAPDADAGEHPLVTAARATRDRKASLVPMRPLAKRPGFFARRRGAKAARDARGADPDDLGVGLAEALKSAGVWDAQADVEAAKKRVLRALTEGRAPVAVVVQAHRAAPFLEALHATGRIAP